MCRRSVSIACTTANIVESVPSSTAGHSQPFAQLYEKVGTTVWLIPHHQRQTHVGCGDISELLHLEVDGTLTYTLPQRTFTRGLQGAEGMNGYYTTVSYVCAG